MGRDGNGSLLHSERASWLDENGIDDPAQREHFHDLWDVAEAERQMAEREYLEEKTERK